MWVGRRLVLALTLPVVALLGVGLALRELRSGGAGDAPARTLRSSEFQKVDRPAPPFELPALKGGGTIALRELAGEVVVLNFWASWCGPCREEAPVLQRLWEEYRAKGVRFLGVNYRDEQGDALAFQREFGITYPSAVDASGELSVGYRLAGVPTTFVVGRDGRIAYQLIGKVEEGALRRALDDALARG